MSQPPLPPRRSRKARAPEGLKQRHLTMIAIGGVIGAGLFVGSGVVINETGPAAFLSYAVTGVLIVMVMRMLGEMATANPSTGLVRRLRPPGARRLGGLLGRPGSTGTSGSSWSASRPWPARRSSRSGSTPRCGCSRSS